MCVCVCVCVCMWVHIICDVQEKARSMPYSLSEWASHIESEVRPHEVLLPSAGVLASLSECVSHVSHSARGAPTPTRTRDRARHPTAERPRPRTSSTRVPHIARCWLACLSHDVNMQTTQTHINYRDKSMNAQVKLLYYSK